MGQEQPRFAPVRTRFPGVEGQVRAEGFQKCRDLLGISLSRHGTRINARLEELPHRFEPPLAPVAEVGHPFAELGLLMQQPFFTREVFFTRNSAIEVRVEEPLQLAGDLRKLLLQSLPGFPNVRCFLAPPGVNLCENRGSPRVRERDLAHNAPELLSQQFLTHEGLRTWPALLRAPVVMMSLLAFGRDGSTAFLAAKQAKEWEGLSLQPPWLAPIAEHLLHAVKEVFRDEGLVAPLVELATVANEADVKRVREEVPHMAEGKRLPCCRA